MMYSIQYLRAIAAILVVILHSFYKESQYIMKLNSNMLFANIGVDIFFVISGFIMAYTFKENSNGNVFLIKRCIRILPLYWLTSILALLSILLFGGQSVEKIYATNIFYSFFLIPSETEFLNPNGWTLTYEFIFYFIFSIPIFMRLNKWQSLKLASVIILCMPLLGWFFDIRTILLETITSSILVEFFYGIIMYCIYYKFNVFKGNLLCSLLMLLISAFMFILLQSYPRYISFGIPALLFCMSIVNLENKLKCGGRNLMFIIGESSYSIYLIHAFILAGFSPIFIKVFGANDSYFFIFLLVVSSIISGLLTYRFVEVKINNLIKKQVAV